jgi:hypothetical protein
MSTFDTRVDFDRDGWKRPRVQLPDSSKVVSYTRCTTFVDALDEKYKLSLWQQRMVAVGMSLRPDLLLGISSLAPLLTQPTEDVPKDAKDKGDELCEKALEAAQASAAATTGTALHEMTRSLDEQRPLGVIPASAQRDIEAYGRATQALAALYVEQPMVNDALQIGGTPDRIVELGGVTYIADVKTGSIAYASLKIAMQLAVYAHSELYDPRKRRRLKTPTIDQKRAIVIWLPAGKAKCELLWVDIARGWQAVQVAKQVRDWRKAKGWMTPVELDQSLFADDTNVSGADEAAQETQHRLAERIWAAPDLKSLTDLWATNRDVWDDSLTELATQRKTALQAAMT